MATGAVQMGQVHGAGYIGDVITAFAHEHGELGIVFIKAVTFDAVAVVVITAQSGLFDLFLAGQRAVARPGNKVVDSCVTAETLNFMGRYMI